MPCMICRARSAADGFWLVQRTVPLPSADEALRLDLNETHRRCCEWVRARRILREQTGHTIPLHDGPLEWEDEQPKRKPAAIDPYE
jgi:hypothetical protein